MANDIVVGAGDGVTFEDGADRGRIVVSSQSTNGAYSIMDWIVASADPDRPVAGFGPHSHGGFEEIFSVRSGELEFLVGDEVSVLGPGDLVRVPAGVRHGYRNVSNAEVALTVTFVPGGFEELFLRYRTDQEVVGGPGFCAEATRDFGSTFE